MSQSNPGVILGEAAALYNQALASWPNGTDAATPAQIAENAYRLADNASEVTDVDQVTLTRIATLECHHDIAIGVLSGTTPTEQQKRDLYIRRGQILDRLLGMRQQINPEGRRTELDAVNRTIAQTVLAALIERPDTDFKADLQTLPSFDTLTDPIDPNSAVIQKAPIAYVMKSGASPRDAYGLFGGRQKPFIEIDRFVWINLSGLLGKDSVRKDILGVDPRDPANKPITNVATSSEMIDYLARHIVAESAQAGDDALSPNASLDKAAMYVKRIALRAVDPNHPSLVTQA